MKVIPKRALAVVQQDAVDRCEDALGYHFEDQSLLLKAVTHASYADTRLRSYERLEFLGDSILGFVVCDYLFRTFPDWLEGELTKVKSIVVSRQTCARIGEELGLEECLIVGKGVGNKGKVPKSLLANAVESIIGAIYLDGGTSAAQEFLLPLIERRVDEAVSGRLEKNYKSELQQYSQKRFGVPPVYLLISQRGPDHEKWFKVAAQISKKTFLPAWGKNKKQAEQRAAANALADIQGEDPPYEDLD